MTKMEETKAPNNVLVNRVAKSGLVTINLEDYFPQHEWAELDIKPYLFHGLILKEKDFREQLSNHDWQQYLGKVLLVFCSTDAIIPVWAYMLISTYAASYAGEIFAGTEEQYLKVHYNRVLREENFDYLSGKRVVIKGCSKKPVPFSAYMDLTNALVPIAQSIMYGEPCSTVPVFKKAK